MAGIDFLIMAIPGSGSTAIFQLLIKDKVIFGTMQTKVPV
jgi:hypothetical protein